jgi:hypothetical protein
MEEYASTSYLTLGLEIKLYQAHIPAGRKKGIARENVETSPRIIGFESHPPHLYY